MMHQNYKMPFNPERLIADNSSIEMCSLAESIAQNLMLLITTKKKENRYDLDYGNAVWDIEFDNAVTTVQWETIFVESLKNQIVKNEPRIVDPRIAVRVVYVAHSYDTRNYSELKKKAKIVINAKLYDTGEPFSFSTALFLSPMSID